MLGYGRANSRARPEGTQGYGGIESVYRSLIY